MYIEKAIYENVGPLNNVRIDFPFDTNGNPKPIIFVGENGCGKSIFLSNIVDAFYEIAGKAFNNALQPTNYYGHQYYKIIAPIQIRFGQPFMYSYLQFNGDDIPSHYYVCKSGAITVDEFKQKTGIQNIDLQWNVNDNYKTTSIKNDAVEKVWNSNVVCYFGPDRYEQPAWMGDKYYNLEEYMHPTILERFKGQLDKPISVKNVTSSNLQWILDVIADSRPDSNLQWILDIIENLRYNIALPLSQKQIAEAHTLISNLSLLRIARSKIEEILSTILGEEVYFSLNFRSSGSSRFGILRKSDNSIICPTLDSLSTGQIALFNMFSTIVRYADLNNINRSFHLEEIKGIVVIDEIELHLHTRLQKEILPQLLKLFPKIQFIITTHAPLFLLGIKEFYGEDNFEIYELPIAEKITTEKFSEFHRAYDYLKETETYQKEAEDAIKEIQSEGKPIIITEGSTDWKHLKAAYNVLKNMPQHKDFFKDLDFEFFEYCESDAAHGNAGPKLEMGNSALRMICENFSKLPHSRKYIFIADRDDETTNQKMSAKNAKYKTWGNNIYSFILPIPSHRTATPAICIEHYYTDEEIKTEWKESKTGIARRLFMGNEFDEFGLANDIDRVCKKQNKHGSDSIKIIDGSSKEKVVSIKGDRSINYALPKSKFAELILKRKAPFDKFNFDSFLDIFQIIKEIINKE